MPRLVVSLFLFSILAFGCTASQPSQIYRVEQLSSDLAVEQIARDVWLHKSSQVISGGVRIPANGLLVRRDGGFVMVDTPWNSAQTLELIDWVEQRFDQGVVAAIGTHFHEDAVGGAVALSERDIPVYGAARTIALAAPSISNAMRSMGSLVPGDRQELRSVEVFFPGAGHSEDNVVVWLPQEKMIFGGCLIKSAGTQSIGNTADANLQTWATSADALLTQYPEVEVIVPGHGLPGEPTAVINNTRRLIQKHVAQSKR